MRKIIFWLLPLAAAAVFCGAARAEDGYSFHADDIMGVSGEVRVSGVSKADAARISSAVFAQWRRLDAKFNYYLPDSEIARINEQAAAEPVKVDSETFSLIQKGLLYSSMTAGRFDITFTPVWELWRSAARRNCLPTDEEIAAALARVNYSAVVLDSAAYTVSFSTCVSINLGGLLREYALAVGAAAVEAEGGSAVAMCSIGGDIVVVGKREKPWKFGIQSPELKNRLAGTVSFRSGFVVTSGAFERFVEIGGRRYCHIIDAVAGRPVEGVSGVTAHFPELGRSYPAAVVFLLGEKAARQAFAKVPGASFLYQKSGGQQDLYRPVGSGADWTLMQEQSANPAK